MILLEVLSNLVTYAQSEHFKYSFVGVFVRGGLSPAARMLS